MCKELERSAPGATTGSSLEFRAPRFTTHFPNINSWADVQDSMFGTWTLVFLRISNEETVSLKSQDGGTLAEVFREMPSLALVRANTRRMPVLTRKAKAPRRLACWREF